VTLPLVAGVRERLASALFERVAGADGPDRRNSIHYTDGPRWFGPDRPIRQVHADASMFVGGLRALLLQSLHPLAMAGVAGHSGYRGDPWGRLHRTSYFLAVTTFGTVPDAQAMIAKIRAIHERVQGTAPDGRPYAASDPHLLRWVAVTEVDSFLYTYQRYGAQPLDQAGRDGYVADVGKVAAALGVIDPPSTEAENRAELQAFRAELQGTRQAREAARFMLLQPPLPLALRAPYGVLAAAAVASLPWWARWPLRLPYLPLAEATVIRLAGDGLVRTIRWAMEPAQPADSTEQVA
jgi:uncharacterized protein (DUF2236 family)